MDLPGPTSVVVNEPTDLPGHLAGTKINGSLRRLLPFAICLFLLPLPFVSCGYHVAGNGTAATIPKNIKTIAIPAFANVTTRYKLTSYLPAAITRELISRTRYQVVNDPRDADAILTGAVVRFDSYPLTLDPATARASTIQTIVTMQITLRDRATNAVLFDRPHFEARQVYELSINSKGYFDESEVALERLSREVARSVVSAILENF